MPHLIILFSVYYFEVIVSQTHYIRRTKNQTNEKIKKSKGVYMAKIQTTVTINKGHLEDTIMENNH